MMKATPKFNKESQKWVIDIQTEDGEIPLEAKLYNLNKEDINTGIDFKVIDNVSIHV